MSKHMDINAVIEDYKKTPQGKYLLTKPDHHVSNCGNATCDFAAFAKVGATMDCWGLSDMSNIHPYWQECKDVGHTVYIYRNKIVDWTFRQFDPTAPCPIVETPTRYSKRFERTAIGFYHVERVPLYVFKEVTVGVRADLRYMLKNSPSYSGVLAQKRRWLELSLQKVPSKT